MVLRRPLPQVPLPWKASTHLAGGAGGTVSAGWGLLSLLLGLCTFEIGLKFGLVALGYQASGGHMRSRTCVHEYLRSEQ